MCVYIYIYIYGSFYLVPLSQISSWTVAGNLKKYWKTGSLDLRKWAPRVRLGPLWGTPLRNLILRALARKMRFRWEKTIWIWMETVVGGFKKSHFARIRAQNEISLEKKLYGYGWKQLWNAK